MITFKDVTSKPTKYFTSDMRFALVYQYVLHGLINFSISILTLT